MVSRFERFSYAIFEISRYWHKIAAEEMEKYGLKGPHSVYLMTLYRCPEGVTATKLGELCGKDKADVSRMLSILESKGLVCRVGASYRALVQLTDAGKAAAEQVQQRTVTAVELGGSGITEEERQTLYRLLELIAANLRTISEAGLPHP